jgi:hypothetical protein
VSVTISQSIRESSSEEQKTHKKTERIKAELALNRHRTTGNQHKTTSEVHLSQDRIAEDY